MGSVTFPPLAARARAGAEYRPVPGTPLIEPVHSTALMLGIGATAVSAAGSWIPSFWGDEAASIMSATRPLRTLWPMLLHVDAVHGLYYVLLHGWIRIFGASELSVRFPSAIAVGLAAAGLVLLANRLAGPRVAAFAGIACAVLPCLTRMGSETREYALSAAYAVWLTWLLVRLVDRRSSALRRGWLLYGAAVAVGIYLFLYLAMMVPVHAAILLATPGVRPALRRFVPAASAGLALAAPVIVLAVQQRQQVAFLARRDQTSPERVLVAQWFGYLGMAAVAWLLITVAVAAWWLRLRRGEHREEGLNVGIPDPHIVGLAWLLLPCVLLLAADLAVPLYSTRYLTFAAPAAALLIGTALAMPRRTWVAWSLALVLVVAAAPAWAHQRQPYARNDGTDWSAVAEVVARNARAGDGIVFGETGRPSQQPRLAMHVYPAAFAGLRDLLLAEPYQERPELWDAVLPLDVLRTRAAGVDRVWLLDDVSSKDWGMKTIAQQGFTVVRVFRERRTTIFELVREGYPDVASQSGSSG